MFACFISSCAFYLEDTGLWHTDEQTGKESALVLSKLNSESQGIHHSDISLRMQNMCWNISWNVSWLQEEYI